MPLSGQLGSMGCGASVIEGLSIQCSQPLTLDVSRQTMSLMAKRMLYLTFGLLGLAFSFLWIVGSLFGEIDGEVASTTERVLQIAFAIGSLYLFLLGFWATPKRNV